MVQYKLLTNQITKSGYVVSNQGLFRRRKIMGIFSYFFAHMAQDATRESKKEKEKIKNGMQHFQC